MLRSRLLSQTVAKLRELARAGVGLLADVVLIGLTAPKVAVLALATRLFGLLGCLFAVLLAVGVLFRVRRVAALFAILAKRMAIVGAAHCEEGEREHRC